eukprot:NODE_3419_length_670_cov_16.270531_g2435_i0.p3 GENE.NODE_3419_length_670_cov_16.270531_g2435_i0~~NODE_3419_length_670_cov_16.270531_g2435_i0.p3  ORF type:complete len:93 (-),score=29.98 NODE_3419_length_670_cov_16.270531_g2435_i0:100-378(-)
MGRGPALEEVPELRTLLRAFAGLSEPSGPSDDTEPRVVLPRLDQRLAKAPTEARDLVSSLLQFHPRVRPTAAEVLQHPFFERFLPMEWMPLD